MVCTEGGDALCSGSLLTSTSDFGHKNIAKYENRDEGWEFFAVHQWNSVIAPDDTVYVLGDFSFYSLRLSRSIMSILNGHKILVLGNHDGSAPRMYRMGFEEVHGSRKKIETPIVIESFDGHPVVLSHAPLDAEAMRDTEAMLNFHGHVHSNMYASRPWHVNVSVDVRNYEPVGLVVGEEVANDVRRLRENRPL